MFEIKRPIYFQNKWLFMEKREIEPFPCIICCFAMLNNERNIFDNFSGIYAFSIKFSGSPPPPYPRCIPLRPAGKEYT